MKTKLYRILLPLAFIIFGIGCQKNNVEEDTGTITKDLVADFNHTSIWEWNELFLRIEKDVVAFRPNPAPRALAYMGLSAYETVVPGMPAFNSIASQFDQELKIPLLDENKKIYWPLAINASYAYLMSNFFFKAEFVQGFGHLSNSDAQKLIKSLQTGLESKYSSAINDLTIVNESKSWGEKVATAIWSWASTDAYGHESNLNPLSNDPVKAFYYNWRAKSQDSNGKIVPGKWYPTNDNSDGGMYPFGGRFRTFATNEAQKLCPPPLGYSENKTSAYYAQALEVYSLCNSTMNYQDRWVSEFWSDDIWGQTFSPPSRLIAILDEIMILENCNLEKAVESVAKLGISLNDCAVACWYSKYYYNVERPENYLKRLVDPNWEPLLQNTINGVKGVTPAFPAYPSGHSTFAGGGAVMLSHLFGSNFEFTDLCHKGRVEFLGIPRTFSSFEDAMTENAYSRITLGVHFRMDCEAGLKLGQQATRRILKLQWKK